MNNTTLSLDSATQPEPMHLAFLAETLLLGRQSPDNPGLLNSGIRFRTGNKAGVPSPVRIFQAIRVCRYISLFAYWQVVACGGHDTVAKAQSEINQVTKMISNLTFS